MRVLKILGQATLFLGVCGGLFFVFDAEAAGGILALFSLIAIQARFILSKVRLKSGARSKVVAAPDLPELDPQRVAGVLKSLSQQTALAQKEKQAASAQSPQTNKKPAPDPSEAEIAAGAANLDSTVFSQFKQNLATSQETLEKPKTVIVADEEVVVNLSTKKTIAKVAANVAKDEATATKPTPTGYNPYGKGGAARKAAPQPKAEMPGTIESPKTEEPQSLKESLKAELPKVKKDNASVLEEAKADLAQATTSDSKLDKIDVGPIGSLFEELEAAESATPMVNQVQPKARKKQADILPPEGAQPETSTDPKVTASEKKDILSPLPSYEFLKDSDLIAPEPDGAQAELLVKMTKKALREERYAQALTSIQGFFDSPEEKEKILIRQVLEMKAQAFFGLEDYHSHQTTIEELLKDYYKKGSKGYLKQLEKVMDRFIKAEKPALALPYLLTALVEYGVADDQKRLDVAYYHIEAAYRALEEPENLTKTLQNHLGVKANLGLKEEQLPLLDQLGKLLFDAGDQEGSRKCYEQVVEIQKNKAAQ